MLCMPSLVCIKLVENLSQCNIFCHGKCLRSADLAVAAVQDPASGCLFGMQRGGFLAKPQMHAALDGFEQLACRLGSQTQFQVANTGGDLQL